MASISTQMLLAINHGRTVAEAAAAPRMNTLRENFGAPRAARPASLQDESVRPAPMHASEHWRDVELLILPTLFLASM
jgi:hypothetical protein